MTVSLAAHKGRMYEILSTRNEIDRVTSSLTNEETSFFGPMSLVEPKFNSAEAGFLYVVSWFYSLWVELAKTNLEFLETYVNTHNLDPDKTLTKHIGTVQHLRTWLQHNLDVTSPRNRAIMNASKVWFRDACRTPEPSTEEHWAKCLEALQEECIAALKVAKACIRRLEQEGDEERNEILKSWTQHRSRVFEPFQFDELINEVSEYLGRPYVDAVRWRKKYFDAWKMRLADYKDNVDISTVARQLVELSLQTEPPLLPITGLDIMRELGLEQGPKVNEALELARQMFSETPCDGPTLIAKVRSAMLREND